MQILLLLVIFLLAVSRILDIRQLQPIIRRFPSQSHITIRDGKIPMFNIDTRADCFPNVDCALSSSSLKVCSSDSDNILDIHVFRILVIWLGMLPVQQSQQSRLFWGNYKLSYQNGHLAAKSAVVGLREGCGAVSSANKHAYQLVIILQPFFLIPRSR